MQGQSSPVQVKDPYTGSILMHVVLILQTHRSVQCTPESESESESRKNWKRSKIVRQGL